METKDKKQELAVISQEETAMVENNNNGNSFDASMVDLSNVKAVALAFEKATAIPVDISAETWTPDAKDYNRAKKLVFMGGGFEEFLDPLTNRIKMTPKVYFGRLEQNEDGENYIKTVRIGCIDLVANFVNIDSLNFATTNKRPAGSMWQITYTGTRPSKTNAVNKINTFSILPLKVNV
jgi:hypothetical protein